MQEKRPHRIGSRPPVESAVRVPTDMPDLTSLRCSQVSTSSIPSIPITSTSVRSFGLSRYFCYSGAHGHEACMVLKR